MNVVLTSMRNEEKYILEWVAWNLSIGFDKVVIFTNHNTDNSLYILDKLQKSGYVEYFELSPPKDSKPQMYAFREGLKWLHKNKPKWVSCLDVDEFLLLKNHNNIIDYVSSFPEDIDAIAINWKIFGCGNITHEGLGLTIERFLLRAQDDYKQHNQFKSLFKYKETLSRFHHRAFYSDDYNYIYSNGKPLTENAKKAGFNLNSKEDNFINFDLAQVNHYTIRSKNEFISKMSRGNGLDPATVENTRDKEYLSKFDMNDVYEVDILDKFDQYLDKYHEIKQTAKL